MILIDPMIMMTGNLPINNTLLLQRNVMFSVNYTTAFTSIQILLQTKLTAKYNIPIPFFCRENPNQDIFVKTKFSSCCVSFVP